MFRNYDPLRRHSFKLRTPIRPRQPFYLRIVHRIADRTLLLALVTYPFLVDYTQTVLPSTNERPARRSSRRHRANADRPVGRRQPAETTAH